MSVRRLDPVQPTTPFKFNAENASWAKKTIAQYPPTKQASAVIALLWRAQEQNEGWVSRPAMEYVGEMLNMAFIRVYEIATFYTMFQLSPVGKKAHIQVCGTTPCMLRGSEELLSLCRKKIHPEPHHLNADGSLSWEEVECLGACVNAPMVQVWKDTYEDLTPATLEKLIDDLQAGRPVKPGPQIDRQQSMAFGGATSLTDKSLFAKPRTFKRVEAPPPPPAAAAPVAPIATGPTPTAVVGTIEGSKGTATPKAMAPASAPAAAPQVANVKTAPQELGAVRITKPLIQRVKKIEPASKPELLKKPRAGSKADDLKLIWGVGPAFEKLLNKTGVWHFDQIASWSAADIKHVDALLKGFQGRIARDEWVKQAKKLAKGWRPENSVGDKPGRK
jgi:NADH-quinone oxidoreductase subunit E